MDNAGVAADALVVRTLVCLESTRVHDNVRAAMSDAPPSDSSSAPGTGVAEPEQRPQTRHRALRVSWRHEGQATKLRDNLAAYVGAMSEYIAKQEHTNTAHPHMVRQWQVCLHSVSALLSLLDFKVCQPLNFMFTGRKKEERDKSERPHRKEPTVAFTVAITAKAVVKSFYTNRQRFLPVEIAKMTRNVLDVINETYFD